MVLLDTGTPVTSREIYSEDADGEMINIWWYDKYIMMQYTNWINSIASQQQPLSCIAQWLEHWVCNLGVASSNLTIEMNVTFF